MNANPQYKDLFDRAGIKPTYSSYAQNMHPNPRFYKYHWRVFHKSSVEGRAFFNSPLLSTFEMQTLCQSLENSGEGYLLYNWSQPRRGKDTPFNFNHSKWQGITTAPSYDEDKNSPWRGHK